MLGGYRSMTPGIFRGMTTKTCLYRAVACLLTWRTCGGMVAQKALTGTATPMLGPKARKSGVDDTWSLRKVWEGPCWEGLWPRLDSRDVLGMRTTAGIFPVSVCHVMSFSSSSAVDMDPMPNSCSEAGLRANPTELRCHAMQEETQQTWKNERCRRKWRNEGRRGASPLRPITSSSSS